MKLKLKLTKTLKRQLKESAVKQDLERNEYVIKELLNHIESKKSIWENKVEGYAEFLVSREENLLKLKESFEDSDIPLEEQRLRLKKYYNDNHMYREYTNKNRKLENLILNLEENQYYALQIIADDSQMTLESYAVTFLNYLIK